MRRRLDLAASLVASPQVLFLDEPTTGLDPRSRNELWDMLRDLVRDGTTVILTTQYLEEADRLADDIVVLDHGRTVAHGTPDRAEGADRQRPRRRHGRRRPTSSTRSTGATAAVRVERADASTTTLLVATDPRARRRAPRSTSCARSTPRASTRSTSTGARPPSTTCSSPSPTPEHRDRRGPGMTATTAPTGRPTRSARGSRRVARARAGLRGWWSDTLVFAGRNIEHIRQIPEKLLDVTLQPLMFVLLFAYVFGGAINVGGGNYREYIIGGILMQSLAFGMTGPATAIATDLTEGVIDRFRSLPANRDRVPDRPLPRRAGGHGAVDRRAARRRALVGWRAHTDVAARRDRVRAAARVRVGDDLDRHVDRARWCARPTR